MPRGRKKKQTGSATGDGNKPLSGGATGGPVLHNVTDDTIKAWAGKIVKADREQQAAKKEYQSKNGFYKQLFKDAGKEGVSAQALSWYVANKDRDPVEIDRETRERNRVAKVMALPIGTQLGLLDDGSTVAGAVDQAKIREAETGSSLPPWEQGKQAALDGKTLGCNPFAEESEDWNEFEQGWGAGIRERAKGYDGDAQAAH